MSLAVKIAPASYNTKSPTKGSGMAIIASFWSGTTASERDFRFNGQLTAVVPALGAYTVPKNRRVAIAAVYHMGNCGFYMGATLIAASFGNFPFRMSHGYGFLRTARLGFVLQRF
jgi:hypothetical protein